MTRAEEVEIKRQKVRTFLDHKSIDGMLLTQQSNFSWYTAGGSNFVAIASEAGAAPILVTQQGDFVIADNIEAPRIVREEIEDLGFEIRSFPWHSPKDLSKIIKELAGERVADDTGPLAEEFTRFRYTLTEAEIERYRCLGNDTAESVDEVCRGLKVGDTELQIAGRLAESLFPKGIVPIVLLIGVDERIESFRHPLPTQKRLKRYAMVVVCARKWGLIVSMTRLVHFGPLPALLRRKHQAVTLVDATFISNTKPGAKVAQIFQRALEAYQKAGFGDEWGLHHQGGATGYAPREFKATPDSVEVVLENQAYAWNPSITGTKSEDTIIATREGPQILTEIKGWPMLDVEGIRRPDILEL